VEFGPSHRKSVSQPTRVHTDVLSRAFPSPTARLLFHHYCNVTSRLLITMGDVGQNPLLTLCTPLTLLDTASATSAAIRMSILSISTAHFAHDTLDGPTEVVSVANTTWSSRCEALETVSARFKKAALCNITLATGKSLSPAEGETISSCFYQTGHSLMQHSRQHPGRMHITLYSGCTCHHLGCKWRHANHSPGHKWRQLVGGESGICPQIRQQTRRSAGDARREQLYIC
jgi:hypothetical protein